MSTRRTDKDFRIKLASINPNIDLLESYINSHTKIKCRCKKCGTEWDARPDHLLNNHGCPVCAHKINGLKRRINKEEFAETIKKTNTAIELLEPYSTSKTKILCKCKTCGYEWRVVPNSLLKGYGCPRCSNRLKKTNEEFIAALEKKSPLIEALEPYQGGHAHMYFRCKVCGCKWKTTPNMIINIGTGCPECKKKQAANKLRKTQETFEQQIHEISPSIEITGDYKNANAKILCKCKRCGNEWKATPSKLLIGRRCPKCDRTQTSFVEQLLYVSLIAVLGENNIVNRDQETIGKELDIYSPELHLAIEYGSYYFHKKHYENDLKKQELCNEKGINLIEIYDNCSQETIDGFSNILTFPFNIGSEPGLVSVFSILKQICEQYNLDYGKIATNRNSLIRAARDNAVRKSTDEFISEVRNVNPNVEIIGGYNGSDEYIHARCRICGREWHPKAYNLLHGHGCPKCSLNPPKRKVICIETGVVYDSMVEAAAAVGLNSSGHIGQCCKGTRNTAGGYHWKLVTD